MKMSVLIYEPDSRGHRLNYVRLIAEKLLETGFQPVIFIHKTAMHSPEFRTNLADIRKIVDIRFQSTVDLKHDMLFLEWQKACELVRIVKQLTPARTYITSGDGIAQMLGLRLLGRSLPTRLETILLAGRSVAPRPKGILNVKYRLSGFLIDRVKWDAVHLNAPVSMEWLRQYSPKTFKRAKVMPDPTPVRQPMPKNDARVKLGLDPDSKWIGCLGPINKRKGIDLLLKAFFHNNGIPECKLFIAGKVYEELAWIRKKYAKEVENGALFLRDEYLNNDDFQTALFALDVLCLPYRGIRWSSSGLILQATAANRPVLTCDRGWIAKVTQDYSLGWMTNVKNIATFHNDLKTCLSQCNEYRMSETARNWLEFNSEKQFKAQLTYNLRNPSEANTG